MQPEVKARVKRDVVLISVQYRKYEPTMLLLGPLRQRVDVAVTSRRRGKEAHARSEKVVMPYRYTPSLQWHRTIKSIRCTGIFYFHHKIVRHYKNIEIN